MTIRRYSRGPYIARGPGTKNIQLENVLVWKQKTTGMLLLLAIYGSRFIRLAARDFRNTTMNGILRGCVHHRTAGRSRCSWTLENIAVISFLRWPVQGPQSSRREHEIQIRTNTQKSGNRKQTQQCMRTPIRPQINTANMNVTPSTTTSTNLRTR